MFWFVDFIYAFHLYKPMGEYTFPNLYTNMKIALFLFILIISLPHVQMSH